MKQISRLSHSHWLCRFNEAFKRIELFTSLAKLLSSDDVAFVFLGNGAKSELISDDRYPHIYYLGQLPECKKSY